MASKSRKRSSCAHAGEVAVHLLHREQRPLLALAAGIADEPGATADQRDLLAARCRRASAMIGSSEPTCRLEAVGSKPTYAVTRSRANMSRAPSVMSYSIPRHSNSSTMLAAFTESTLSLRPNGCPSAAALVSHRPAESAREWHTTPAGREV